MIPRDWLDGWTTSADSRIDILTYSLGSACGSTSHHGSRSTVARMQNCLSCSCTTVRTNVRILQVLPVVILDGVPLSRFPIHEVPLIIARFVFHVLQYSSIILAWRLFFPPVEVLTVDRSMKLCRSIVCSCGWIMIAWKNRDMARIFAYRSSLCNIDGVETSRFWYSMIWYDVIWYDFDLMWFNFDCDSSQFDPVACPREMIELQYSSLR